MKIALANMGSNQQRYDPVQRVKEEIETHNASIGYENLIDGIDCPKCKNRGNIAVPRENPRFHSVEFSLRDCSCMAARKSFRRLERSGLKNLIGRYTMDLFTAETPWHESMKKKAVDYIEGRGSEWFFAGGQVGCGKSHICTAICGELIRRGEEVYYMLWKDESTRLKSLVNDEELYNDAISRLKTVPVLYIDDLFKMQRTGKDGAKNMPTAADINLAFEIINARYMDETKKTVISCEWFIDDLVNFDEGVASRIYERSRASCIEISRDMKKNYRLTGGDRR